MKFLVGSIKSLTKFETVLWLGSVVVIVLSFLLPKEKDIVTLFASLIGATALIFVSKGNVIGQILTVVFSVFYGVISYSFMYYGEMITYLGMTTPIAIISIITWLKNPYKGNNREVQIKHLTIKEYIFLFVLATAITVGFYFILKVFNTNYLIISTISVFTSFAASYLTVRRSEFYAIAYAFNDVVLIILWVLATIAEIKYLPMIICFVVFLVNDLYGFFNWSKTKKRQMLN